VTFNADSMSSPTKSDFLCDMQTKHRLSIPTGPLSVSKDSNYERALLRVAVRHVSVDMLRPPSGTFPLWASTF
jgi:hypothetical protein